MSQDSSPSKAVPLRSPSSLLSRHYPKIGRRKITPGIPKAANWGWGHLPLPAKIMVAGVLCGVISLTTPYWAYIRAEIFGLSTFGLWHYCSGDVCNSIHDNLVEGRSVEAWFHFTQGSMCIGVACSIVGLAMLTNSIEGRKLWMTPTVHTAVSSILAISALEQFVATVIFANYLDNSGFLFTSDGVNKVDFYGSYYLGVASFICSLVATFIVYLAPNYTRRRKLRRSFEFDISNPEHVKLLREFYHLQGDAGGEFLQNPQHGFDDYAPYCPMDRSGEELRGYDNGGYDELEGVEKDGEWYNSPPMWEMQGHLKEGMYTK